MSRRLLLLAWLGLALRALAHPVAQGSAELSVTPRELQAEFRVSNEQIFVASTFGANATTAANLSELWSQHAAYLLAHLHVTADGQPLTGELMRVTPPDDPTIKGFTRYALRFPFPTASPGQLIVREDLLQEIDFAPGNPWEASFVVRVAQEGRVLHEARLLSAKQPLDLALAWNLAADFTSPPATGLWRLAREFFVEGARHIAGGWDHALFVVALVLAVARFWHVVALVTAFTLAHTVTITLGILGLVPLPRGLVEPMIAVSIIVAAVLNFWRPREAPLTPRMAVAFGFGLFHGLGFAGGLIDAMADFTTKALVAAIGAFSVGVEVGHQVIVLPLVALMLALRRWKPDLVPAVARGGSVVVALLGGYLLVLALR